MSTHYRDLRYPCPHEGCHGHVMLEALSRPRPGGESGYRCSTMALFHIPAGWTPQLARDAEDRIRQESAATKRSLAEDDPLF